MATEQQIATFASIVEGSISEITDGEVTEVGVCAFYGCSALATASFPAAITIQDNAFRDCINLTTASFPAATAIGASAFAICSRLNTVSFPSVSTIGGSAFQSCTSLTTASFPNVSSIGTKAFIYCYRLTELHLEGVPSVPTLGNNAFNSTPIGGYSTSAGAYGSVFVPASLYSSFLTAAYWSDIASRIVSVA